MSKLLKSVNVLVNITRGKKNKVISRPNRNYNWKDEGIQYPGFKYYPRYPDFEDPPYEPSKLFAVRRVKPLFGVPFYEKKILAEFKLDGKEIDVAIVKNIPETNHRLWKIKHLVKIEPVTFPDGFPTDTKGTYLKENGELTIKHRLDSARLQLTNEFRNDPKRIDGDTLRRDSRKKWLTAW